MVSRPNILIFMSDEHSPSVCGCYGNKIVQTPTLDRLAAQGITFENAYTSSPMCVPARMSFLTGQYPGRVNVWDNGSILGGEFPTFANYLTAEGYETVLCGRMHMLGEDRCHGFSHRLYDDMLDWMNPRQTPHRTPQARRKSNSHVTECGPGTGSWQEYDKTSVDLAKRYLRRKAEHGSEKPWMMVVGCMFPHFPLIAPPEMYQLYQDASIPLPPSRHDDIAAQHPAIAQLRKCFCNDQPLSDDIALTALRSYYALVTLVDSYIGSLVDIVDHSPLAQNTVILYVSDHGEMAGSHGIWQKQCFYEEAVRIPLIMRLPPSVQSTMHAGMREKAHVSLVDLFTTILDLAKAPPVDGLPGISLLSPVSERTILSEYHAQGMLSGGYMLLRGRYKLCYYVGHEPELFDLETDPDELHDLHAEPAYAGITNELIQLLQNQCAPEEADRIAKEDQKKRLARFEK